MSTARWVLRRRFTSKGRAFVFFVVCAAVGRPAVAEGNDLPASYPAPSIDPGSNAWSGFYVGGSVGGVWVRSTLRTTVALSSAPSSYFLPSTIPVIDDAGRQRIQSGAPMDVLQTGYTWQRGPWVAGLEADFGHQDLSGQSTASGVYPCCAPTGFSLSQGIRSNWLATVRPRIGVTHAHVMFFLSGGVAVSDVRTGFAFADNNSHAAASGSVSHTAIGYAVGGGVEARLTRSWTIKADYLRVDLGTQSGSSTNLITYYGPSPDNRFQYSADMRANLARLGVSYRFH